MYTPNKTKHFKHGATSFFVVVVFCFKEKEKNRVCAHIFIRKTLLRIILGRMRIDCYANGRARASEAAAARAQFSFSLMLFSSVIHLPIVSFT